MKRWPFLVLKIAISVALIGLLFQSVGLKNSWDRMLEASPGPMGAAMTLLLFQLIINTCRWRAVMRPMKAWMPFRQALRINFIGAFLNQTLPGSVGGDVMRVYKAYKSGLTLQASINSVMLERVATVLGLILLVVISQPMVGERFGSDFISWAFPLLLAAGIAGIVLLMQLDRVPYTMHRWRLVRALVYLAADARSVFLTPSDCLRVMMCSTLGHANVSISMWLVGMSLGLDDQFTILDSMVLIPPVILLSTLPISIAGWGVREGGMVAAMALIGVPGESAMAVSILFGLTVIVTALPGGVVWMMSSDRSIGRPT